MNSAEAMTGTRRSTPSIETRELHEGRGDWSWLFGGDPRGVHVANRP